MVCIKQFLACLVLYSAQRTTGRVYLNTGFFKVAQRFGINIFNLYGQQVYVFTEFYNRVIIHQVAGNKMVASDPAGCFTGRVHNFGIYIELPCFLQQHFPQLSAPENSQFKIGRKIVHGEIVLLLK